MVESFNLKAPDAHLQTADYHETPGGQLNLLHLVGNTRTEGGGTGSTPPPRTEGGGTTINNSATAGADANASARAGVVNNNRTEGGTGGTGGTGIGGNSNSSVNEKSSYIGGVALGANSWALPQCGKGWGGGVAAFFAGLNLSKTDMDSVCQLNNNVAVDSQAGIQALGLLVNKLEAAPITAQAFDDKMNMLLAKFGAKMLSEAVTQADEGRIILENKTGVRSNIAADLPQFTEADLAGARTANATSGQTIIYEQLQAQPPAAVAPPVHHTPRPNVQHHYKTVCEGGHFVRKPID